MNAGRTHTEIEAKLKVENHNRVLEGLQTHHGQFKAQQYQRDDYYDNADRTLTGTDQCLRLRHEQDEHGQRCILTYKGPRAESDLKIRKEIELSVDNPQAAADLLEALQYTKRLVVEKQRQLWQQDNCLVALDRVTGLGTFVEIEGPSTEEVLAVHDRLNLTDCPRLTDSYASMVARLDD